jgi:hypothetical protein
MILDFIARLDDIRIRALAFELGILRMVKDDAVVPEIIFLRNAGKALSLLNSVIHRHPPTPLLRWLRFFPVNLLKPQQTAENK